METSYLPKHHAILYSTFALAITTHLPNRGEELLKELTIGYAIERAKRMAKRSVAYNIENRAIAFLMFSELTMPQDIAKTSVEFGSTDIILTTTKCPWYDAWEKHSHLQYARSYCKYIDCALASGFDNSLWMEVPCTIMDGHNKCKFILCDTDHNVKDIEIYNKYIKDIPTSNKKSFLYHTGHLYNYFNKHIKEKFPSIHKELMEDVRCKYTNIYGNDVIKNILNIQSIDYTKI